MNDESGDRFDELVIRVVEDPFHDSRRFRGFLGLALEKVRIQGAISSVVLLGAMLGFYLLLRYDAYIAEKWWFGIGPLAGLMARGVWDNWSKN